MTTAVVCIALLGLLVFGLGFATSLARGRANVVTGVPDDPAHPLAKLHRAHGNSAEFCGILAILIWVSAQTGGVGTWVEWAWIAGTAGRTLIVVGLMTGSMADVNPLRFVGALTTYLAGLALVVDLLI